MKMENPDAKHAAIRRDSPDSVKKASGLGSTPYWAGRECVPSLRGNSTGKFTSREEQSFFAFASERSLERQNEYLERQNDHLERNKASERSWCETVDDCVSTVSGFSSMVLDSASVVLDSASAVSDARTAFDCAGTVKDANPHTSESSATSDAASAASSTVAESASIMHDYGTTLRISETGGFSGACAVSDTKAQKSATSTRDWIDSATNAKASARYSGTSVPDSVTSVADSVTSVVESEMESIWHAVKDQCKISQLWLIIQLPGMHISDAVITRYVIPHVTRLLARTSVKELWAKVDLGDNPLTSRGCMKLLEFLESRVTLKSIKVDKCQLTDEAGVGIARILATQNEPVEQIDVSYNDLTVVSWVALLCGVLNGKRDFPLYLRAKHNDIEWPLAICGFMENEYGLRYCEGLECPVWNCVNSAMVHVSCEQQKASTRRADYRVDFVKKLIARFLLVPAGEENTKTADIDTKLVELVQMSLDYDASVSSRETTPSCPKPLYDIATRHSAMCDSLVDKFASDATVLDQDKSTAANKPENQVFRLRAEAPAFQPLTRSQLGILSGSQSAVDERCDLLAQKGQEIWYVQGADTPSLSPSKGDKSETRDLLAQKGKEIVNAQADTCMSPSKGNSMRECTKGGSESVPNLFCAVRRRGLRASELREAANAEQAEQPRAVYVPPHKRGGAVTQNQSSACNLHTATDSAGVSPSLREQSPKNAPSVDWARAWTFIFQ